MKKIIPFSFFYILSFSLFTGFAQEPVLTITSGHAYEVTSMSVSPDGKYLLSGSIDNTLKIWDISSGKEIKTFSGHSKKIYSVCFSPDGQYALSGSKDKTLKLWDISMGKEIRTFSSHSDGVMSVCFSPDGRYALSASSDNTIILWEISTANAVRTFTGHNGYVSSVCFSPDGKFAISGSDDNTLKLWDISTGNEIKTFTGHSKTVTSTCFSPDGKYAISGSRDYTLKLWDINNGNEIRTFIGHSNAVTSVCISANGKNVLSGSQESIIKLWEISTGNEIKSYNLYSYDGTKLSFLKAINSVCFSTDGKFAFSSRQYDRTIKQWELATGKEVSPSIGLLNKINSVSISPDGKFILSGGSDNTLKLCEIATGKVNNVFTGHTQVVQSVCFSPDGKYLLSGSEDSTIRLWDITKGLAIKTFKGHSGKVWSVCFSPDRKSVLSGSMDNTLKIWDISTGLAIQTFTGHRASVNSVSISPDGRFALSGSSDQLLKLWDISTGKEIRTFTGHSVSVLSVCFSPDGKYALSGSGRGSITIGGRNYDGLEVVKLWDISTGNEVKTFSGYSNRICSVCFSPDGKYILSGGYENTLKLWEVSTGQERGTFSGHSAVVRSVCFSRDGKYAFSGSDDNTIKFWDISTKKEMCTIYYVNKDNYLDKKDYVVSTPNGRFDGSEEGLKQLYYVRGMEMFSLESLFEWYYTPRLLTRVLGREQFNKVDISIATLKPKAEVKIITPSNNSKVDKEQLTVIVKATDKGGGVDEIRLYQNGKLLDGTQRGFKATGQNKEFVVTLTDGENRIKATAFNSQRTESIPDEIIVNFKATQQVKPNMYILAIGINSYLNPKYSLNFAKNDAEAFTQSLTAGASSLFGKVEVASLSDANATRAGILQAIDKIKAIAKAEDVFVFYYAGHGVMSTGSETEKPLFYVVPHDVTKMYEADEMLKKSGISAAEIGEFSKNIKAQKQLFVIDACQSGGAMQTLAMRGAAEEKAIAQLARSTGTYFIAASGTEQFATEVAELGHGVFTYALIEALKGSCSSQDGKVTVNLLKSCIETNVPELSKKYKGQPQFPTGYGFGQDFPIVIVK